MSIKQPDNSTIRIKLSSGTATTRLVWKPGFAVRRSSAFSKVQKFVDSEVLRYTEPYVPFDTGYLKRSGILGTVKGSGRIHYIAPYAKSQHKRNAGRGKEGTANGGLRGRLFFERMKADHRDDILRGARKIAGDDQS